jgi:hypothetical protein
MISELTRGKWNLDKRSNPTRKQCDGDRCPAEFFDSRLLSLVFVRVRGLASRQIAM